MVNNKYLIISFKMFDKLRIFELLVCLIGVIVESTSFHFVQLVHVRVRVINETDGRITLNFPLGWDFLFYIKFYIKTVTH
jgi:hypothetical protein